jgi:hypothetical protein
MNFGGRTGSLGLSLALPIEKALVAKFLLPADRGGIEVGLVELREPVGVRFWGGSSERHARDQSPVNAVSEMIQMGPLGRLQPGY